MCVCVQAKDCLVLLEKPENCIGPRGMHGSVVDLVRCSGVAGCTRAAVLPSSVGLRELARAQAGGLSRRPGLCLGATPLSVTGEC